MTGGLEYPLPSIPYLTLKFNLPALQAARLPAFKGSLLRGAFGNALRRTVCVMGPKQPCGECFLNRQCVNTKLFETTIGIALEVVVGLRPVLDPEFKLPCRVDIEIALVIVVGLRPLPLYIPFEKSGKGKEWKLLAFY